MTDTTSDAIEQMLAKIESRQVKCPNCGGTDGNIMIPYWDLCPARFEFDGTVRVSDAGDQNGITKDKLKVHVCCHKCNLTFELPDHATVVWDSKEYIRCECEQESEDRRVRNLLRFIEDGEPTCTYCKQVAYWVGLLPPENGGQWSHARTEPPSVEQRRCGAGDAIKYIHVIVPDYEATHEG